MNEGVSFEQAFKFSGFKSRSTLYTAISHYKQFGAVNSPSYVARGRPRLCQREDLQYMLDCIALKPTVFLDKIQEVLKDNCTLDLHKSTIYQMLRREGCTWKQVSREALERSAELLALFILRVGGIRPEQFLFLDESSHWNNYARRQGGWAKRGERVIQTSPFDRGQRYSVLPVLSLEGIETWTIVEGSVTREIFDTFFLEQVVSLVLHCPWSMRCCTL